MGFLHLPRGIHRSHGPQWGPTRLPVLAVAFLLAMLVSAPAQGAPDTERDSLTASELLDVNPGTVDIVDNGWFLPAGDSGPTLHTLEGVISVPRTALAISENQYWQYAWFPAFSVEFFTHDGYLVPAVRDLITHDGEWSLILSPGKVWSESADGGMSRASFPFTLGSPPDYHSYTGGEAHNGVATFLFDDHSVSSLRLQVTQETAPDDDIFDLWGQIPMEYTPGPIADRDALAAEFATELADQVPIMPWSDLEASYDPETVDLLTEGLPADTISAAGVIVDGTVYLQPSHTRHGEYPYPRQMLQAAMSISKSIGTGVGMLWLAQKYGEDVFDLRIVDYLDVTADHDGWSDVTFGDVLDMATGVGDNAPTLRPFDVDANESGDNYRRFYLAATTAEKLDAAYGSVDYPWGPEVLFRYTSAQSFVLSAAMDAFLKEQEGPDAHLWLRMSEEVFEPIGVHHLTMMHVASDDGPGIPLMASGLRLTVDDLAKITTLLQQGGVHGGVQILHPGKVAEALARTGELVGLPSGRTFAYGDQGYHMSFWTLPYRTADKQYFQVPFMSGAGGNTVFLAPNGVTTFVFTDFNQDTYSLQSPAVAEAIAPYPSKGVGAVRLIDDGIDPIVLVIAGVVVVGLVVGLIVWRRRRKAVEVEVAP